MNDMNDKCKKCDKRSQWWWWNIQAPAPEEKKDYEAVEMKDKDVA